MKKSIWKLASLFAAVLALSLCFAGCSSDDDDGGSSGGTTTGGSSSEGDSSSVRAALVGKYYAFHSVVRGSSPYDDKGYVVSYFTLTDKDTCVVKTSNIPTTTEKSLGNSSVKSVYNYGDSWAGNSTLTFEKSFDTTLVFKDGDESVYLYSSSGNFTEAEGDIIISSITLESPIEGYQYVKSMDTDTGKQAYYYGESEPTPNQAAKATGAEVSE